MSFGTGSFFVVWKPGSERKDSGDEMGCDGGTIPKRHELVKGPRKIEKVRGEACREGPCPRKEL